jgi:DNA-binding GntR family transcriptional regulator
MPFRRLKIKGVSKETYDILKSKILAGELAPGQRVDVALISHELGVSRTPVNEALQTLSVQGLIEIVPRKGTFVPRVTPRDVEDAFQLRLALEAKACELAAPVMDASKTAALRKLNERLAQGNLDLFEHLRTNQQFHKLIVEYANNSMLLKFYLEVQARMHFLEVYFVLAKWQNTSSTVVDEHNEIIEALAANHPGSAQKLMTDHIHSAMMRLISVIQAPKESNSQQPDPQDDRMRTDPSLPSSP